MSKLPRVIKKKGISPPVPVISDVPSVQAEYESLVLSGMSHNLAEMVATKSSPMIRRKRHESEYYVPVRHVASSRAFMEGKDRPFYCAGVGAVVSSLDDVLEIAKQKNLTLHGAVERQAIETEEAPSVVIADDILEERASRQIAVDPDIRNKIKEKKMSKSELKQEIAEKIAYRPDRHWLGPKESDNKVMDEFFGSKD